MTENTETFDSFIANIENMTAVILQALSECEGREDGRCVLGALATSTARVVDSAEYPAAALGGFIATLIQCMRANGTETKQ